MSFEQRVLINYDKPATLDDVLLLRHMERLSEGEPIQRPCYCFVTLTRTPEVEEISAAPIVILEGLMALWDEPPEVATGRRTHVCFSRSGLPGDRFPPQ